MHKTAEQIADSVIEKVALTRAEARKLYEGERTGPRGAVGSLLGLGLMGGLGLRAKHPSALGLIGGAGLGGLLGARSGTLSARNEFNEMTDEEQADVIRDFERRDLKPKWHNVGLG